MAQNFFLKEPAPTKVQVVNEDSEPVKAEIDNLPLASDGSSIRAQLVNSYILGLSAGSTTNFIVTFDNILILNADGGFASLPLHTSLYNVTQSQINSSLANIKAAYATLVANATSATLHYCQFNNTKIIQSYTYDLKAE